MAKRRLTVDNHDRDATGQTYVYAVLSRRAKGVSLGINLNPNRACNWRCVYCQVEGLSAGKGPPIDLDQLETELEVLLGRILDGSFFEEQVPEAMRSLKDVAFSGDGEPTSSPDFGPAVDRVVEVLGRHPELSDVPITVITNGTMLDKTPVQEAIVRLAEARDARVWFKLDRATPEGLEAVNSRAIDVDHHLRRLRWSAAACPTWIQTCVFAIDGEPPSREEQEAYLEALSTLAHDGVPLWGVLLYGLARPSHQPEAPRLSPLSAGWLEGFARQIEGTGFPVHVHA